MAIRWSGSHGYYGNLSEQVAYAVSSGQSCRDLVLADVNNDQFLDIVVVHDFTAANAPQPAVPPGITVLWNDKNNHFGGLTHVPLPFEEAGEILTSGRPVSISAIYLDGGIDGYPELVVVGRHQFLTTGQKGTITVVRFDPVTAEFDVESLIELEGGVPIRAIAMPPKYGEPERDIAILKNDQTVAIHRCTTGVPPYYEATGYAGQILDSNDNPSNGRDLTYFWSHNHNWLDLAVIPEESGYTSSYINVFVNNREFLTLTLGNGGIAQQLTHDGVGNFGHLWRVIRYPSTPYDGILVLNQDSAAVDEGETSQGVQVSRFLSTGTNEGTLNVASREDLVDNSHDPTRAVMALGDISRSCGRDLVVADHFAINASAQVPSLPRLSLARCPFDNGSRSFDRPALSTPTCAVIANVDNANGPDLIVGTARDDDLFDVGRVLVFRQTPTAPNRFDFVPSEPPYLPQVGGFDVEAEIRAMKSGDFGPGALPDVVMGFNFGGQQYLQVLRRTSTTAFEVRPETSVTNTGLITALTVGNFDSDGLTDVVTLVDGPAPNLFLSRGLSVDGTLGAVEPVDEFTAHFGAGLVSMRNSSTGRLDLCTLLPDPAVRILQNNGGGTFGSPIDLVIDPPPGGTTMPSPKAITTGSFPGVAAPYIACTDIANNQVVVFADFGGGYDFVWSRIVSNSDQIHPISIVSADLEADGDDDLIVGFDRGNTITVLTCITLNRPFQPIILPSGREPGFVTTGDIDGNGLPDILEVGGTQILDSHLRVIVSNCGGM